MYYTVLYVPDVVLPTMSLLLILYSSRLFSHPKYVHVHCHNNYYYTYNTLYGYIPSKWLWLLRYSGSSFDLSPPRLGLGHPYFSFVCTSVFASLFALALAFTFTPHAMQFILACPIFFASEARPSPHIINPPSLVAQICLEIG